MRWSAGDAERFLRGELDGTEALAATPDPVSPTGGGNGVVCLANAYCDNTTSGTLADWRTWNWSVNPK